MQKNYNSSRLDLRFIDPGDADFIFELLNSPGWIEYIGDRNIHSLEDAEKYIQKITDSTDIQYWIVRLREDKIPIGMVSFIKRVYLEYHDIGFAFLPAFTKKGYAREATETVLNDLLSDHPVILATAIPENHASISLLKKLGFHFKNEIERDKVKLSLFSNVSPDSGSI